LKLQSVVPKMEPILLSQQRQSQNKLLFLELFIPLPKKLKRVEVNAYPFNAISEMKRVSLMPSPKQLRPLEELMF